jgi:hypothetical protein
VGGTATSGQGFNGGNGSTDGDEGGGGGGASAVGTAGVNLTSRGNGGAGTASSISGSSVTYGGGGGGGGHNTAVGGTGGAGGGGSSPSTQGAGGDGTANTGGGGAGGYATSANQAGGAGGSGIVIVSYTGTQRFIGGTVTTSGGNIIHTFTSSGVLTSIFSDQSPQGNNLTPNNISLTLGSTYDSMTDVPTLTSTTAANYCVLNPLSNSYTGTAIIGITDGNLNFSDSTSTSKTAVSSMTSPTGKWYFEMTSSSTGTYAVGLFDIVSNSGSFYRNNGTYSSSFGGGGTSGYASWTTGDVIGVAWDADAGKLWFAKNNTWQSGDPSTGTSPTNTFTAGLSLFADIYTDNSAGTKSGAFNFGQQPWVYTPPKGFLALNTFNL